MHELEESRQTTSVGGFHKPPVCIGLLGWDTTLIGDSHTKSFGGAVPHFVLAAAVVGVKFKPFGYVNLVDWSKLIQALSRYGIDCTGLINSSSTVEFVMPYDKDLNFLPNQFEMTVPDHEPDISAHLADHLAQGQFVHICPSMPERESKFLEIALQSGGEISLQMHKIPLVTDRQFYRETSREVDYVFLNEEEALILSGKANLEGAIQALRQFPGTCFYITSKTWAMAVTAQEVYRCPSLKLSVIDPTGAGDAFAGGCTAGRILTGRHDAALRMGTLCAAAKLTDFSSNALLSLLNIEV